MLWPFGSLAVQAGHESVESVKHGFLSLLVFVIVSVILGRAVRLCAQRRGCGWRWKRSLVKQAGPFARQAPLLSGTSGLVASPAELTYLPSFVLLDPATCRFAFTSLFATEPSDSKMR